VAFAIIAAGGRGSRLGSPTPKFECELLGKPLLMHSLEAFQAATAVDEIVIVVPEENLGAWAIGELRKRGIRKVSSTVVGGETRQESVLRGLERVGDDSGVVVVHDAARPLVTAGMIDGTCNIPESADGIITAVGVTDTIKVIDAGLVVRTLDRSQLVEVQTPQAFRLNILRSAHAAAEKEGYHGTDDSSLVERIGGRVAVIAGSRDNIKITFPRDLALAETIISERSRY
jgi:2-C-methyl-D-erythritol 4-phosphate cytidylyltransferase